MAFEAADQFRNMDPRAQRLVLNRGSLEGSRDPTAAFIGRPLGWSLLRTFALFFLAA